MTLRHPLAAGFGRGQNVTYQVAKGGHDVTSDISSTLKVGGGGVGHYVGGCCEQVSN